MEGGGALPHSFQKIGFIGLIGFWDGEKHYKTLLKPIIHQKCLIPNIVFYLFYAGFERFLMPNVVFPYVLKGLRWKSLVLCMF